MPFLLKSASRIQMGRELKFLDVRYQGRNRNKGQLQEAGCRGEVIMV